MNEVIKDIVKNKKPCYFISPHLDDAAFSAGGLISYLAKNTDVYVITVFTQARNIKHSLSGLAYAKKCGYSGATVGKFFFDRRKEDKEALESIGAKVIHLEYLDALWRINENMNFLYKVLSFFLNDFRYIYPTYRLHIAKGIIHRHDHKNLRRVERELKTIVGSDDNPVVFCPLGVGKHVDHLFTREVCKKTFNKVIYWEDSPYNLYHQYDKHYITRNKLSKIEFSNNQDIRKSLYPMYKTQFGKLFGGADFNLPIEKYYFKKE